MVDRLKELLQKIVEWWNKFTSKQKTIIISVTAGVVLALAILATMLTRPQYETLITCESTKQAAEIVDLLDGDSITRQVSDDGLVISVLKQDISRATLLLGANNYPADSYSLEAALSGGFSTTESDKAKTYKLYQESHLQDIMEATSNVRAAYVTLSIPDNDGTLLAKEEESYASVMLDLTEPLGEGIAENFAKNIATALGNKTTENVTIIDIAGNLLYSGAEAAQQGANVVNTSNQIALKAEAEKALKQEVIQVLLGSNLYEDVKVSPNLAMDFSSTNETEHTYTQADASGTNVISHENTYESEGGGGSGGVPGTDTNNEETTYVIDNGEGGSYSVTEESKDYLPGEKITDKVTPPGAIDYNSSSIGITASHFVVYKESDVKAQGLLDGITFDEFILQNSEMVKKTVDEEMITLVSNATGIPSGNISIVAYDVPIFQPDEGLNLSPSNIAQIVLIVLILALLLLVVLTTFKRQKEEEPQVEELSVENLLETTQAHSDVEDIDIETKSEVRMMVEKFVEENPDASAQLLRNWLNEEWG